MPTAHPGERVELNGAKMESTQRTAESVGVCWAAAGPARTNRLSTAKRKIKIPPVDPKVSPQQRYVQSGIHRCPFDANSQ